jgi:hypothetical protein
LENETDLVAAYARELILREAGQRFAVDEDIA